MRSPFGETVMQLYHTSAHLAFNKVARAKISLQASSASAERLFGDLGRMEGRALQSMLTSTVGMKENIRVYVDMRMKDIVLPRMDILHAQETAFMLSVTEVAEND